MTTPRAHADMANLFYSDGEMKCWYWLPGEGRWIETDSPTFTHMATFHVGKEAPTEPPPVMCELAGVKFPMPAQNAPGRGCDYYLPNICEPVRPAIETWDNVEFDYAALDFGMVQLTTEGATEQARAMAAALKQAIEKAKEQMK
ncbi:MAG: hypothetical protein Q4A28_06375 [Brachymonas sp.]|nr:hypothetical protein [Brachymonas sp.]